MPAPAPASSATIPARRAVPGSDLLGVSPTSQIPFRCPASTSNPAAARAPAVSSGRIEGYDPSLTQLSRTTRWLLVPRGAGTRSWEVVATTRPATWRPTRSSTSAAWRAGSPPDSQTSNRCPCACAAVMAPPDQLAAVVARGDRVGDQPDRAALLGAQAAGRQVGSVVELAGGAQDTLTGLLGDPPVASAEDERHRRGRDTGPIRDVAQSYPRPPRSAHCVDPRSRVRTVTTAALTWRRSHGFTPAKSF